jgi:hypothetical protein
VRDAHNHRRADTADPTVHVGVRVRRDDTSAVRCDEACARITQAILSARQHAHATAHAPARAGGRAGGRSGSLDDRAGEGVALLHHHLPGFRESIGAVLGNGSDRI